MTRDEAKKILGENATEEQVTNLLNSYHLKETEKVKELEKQINSLTEQNSKYSDYDSIKKQLDEINKANMSEQEKIAQQKKEADEYYKQSKIIYNTAKAKEILAGLDLDDDIISLVVSDDENKTIDSANRLKAKFDSQKETVAKATKESLITQPITPDMTNVNLDDKMTLDKFSNLSATEQEQFIKEHPTEFENL